MHYWIYTTSNDSNTMPHDYNKLQIDDILIFYVMKVGIIRITKISHINKNVIKLRNIKKFDIPIKIKDLNTGINCKRFIKLYINCDKLVDIGSCGKNIMDTFNDSDEEIQNRNESNEHNEVFNDSESGSISSAEIPNEEDLNKFDDITGFIPVLLTACDELEYHISAKTCISHYLKCRKCQITNNNTKEISHIIKDSKISFTKVTKITEDLENIITAYQTPSIYKTINNINDVEMYHITDKRSAYINSVFIIVCL